MKLGIAALLGGNGEVSPHYSHSLLRSSRLKLRNGGQLASCLTRDSGVYSLADVLASRIPVSAF